MINLELIKSYGIDIEYIGKTSGFELINTLAVRDKIEEEYYSLSTEERAILFEYDQNLLNNAVKFHSELSQFYNFSSLKPLNHWWAHIDKVVSGELTVDLCTREVQFKNDTEHAATLTA